MAVHLISKKGSSLITYSIMVFVNDYFLNSLAILIAIQAKLLQYLHINKDSKEARKKTIF